MKGFFAFLTLVLAVEVFSFTYFGEEPFTIHDLSFVSFMEGAHGAGFGVNFSDRRDVVNVLEKKVFFRKVKVKMKVREEFFRFRVLWNGSAAASAEYRVRTLFPLRSESYVMFLASKRPFVYSESSSSLFLLGYGYSSFSLSFGEFSYSLGILKLRNVSFGMFSGNGKYLGLGEDGNEASGIFGFGILDEGLGFGVNVLLRRNWGRVGFGLEFGKRGMFPVFALYRKLGEARFSLLFMKGRVFLALHR